MKTRKEGWERERDIEKEGWEREIEPVTSCNAPLIPFHLRHVCDNCIFSICTM